jgi:hypothetical protein
MGQAALTGAALVMGLASGPHCIAMCGAASAAVIRIVPVRAHAGSGGPGAPAWVRAHAAFHVGRAASYALAGAFAAASMGGLALASGQVAALRPLWTLLHVFVLAWGAMLAIAGRQPVWTQRIGRRLEARLRPLGAATPLGVLATGALWVAMPCGLLHSALLLASLGNRPWDGGLAMLAFALGSGLSLALGPWLWRRLYRQGEGSLQAWGARLSGVLLVAVALQALWSDLGPRIDAWCR